MWRIPRRSPTGEGGYALRRDKATRLVKGRILAMRLRKKTIVSAMLVALIAAIYGAITAPNAPLSACEAFQERMQQVVLSGRGFGGAMLLQIYAPPEKTVNQVVSERYKAMAKEQCSAWTKASDSALAAFSHSAWALRMEQADAPMRQALQECGHNRLHIKSAMTPESAQCIAPKVMAVFQSVGYPYMDLVALFNARNVHMAQQFAAKAITQDAYDAMTVKLAVEITEQEIARILRTR